ncbi:AAA family ATPase [Agrobacterium rhizogenes]|uniref:ATP-binding protein n=1 Tax=Rhizobium rhizogenes TaxID=359 RepID=UPI00157430D8|nr:AAA family ATPase [Rhizobium rhizogenes]NTI17045.1 AAA family ATPase [Rhizobium rhizogenes]
MSGWFLERLEIEGFRGINNEGDPLVLKLNKNAVNSITAPNGVGKSSIYDALTFALQGAIRKLDDLPAAESGSSYYNNLFHSQGIGKITLVLSPAAGGDSVTIVVTRDKLGSRTVTGPAGMDADALLAELNREFVLLDHKTLQTFIDDKALDRGRSFSGLLGLAQFSTLRQQFQALANTRAYNNHVNMTDLTGRRSATEGALKTAHVAAAAAFKTLTQEDLAEQGNWDAALAKAHSSLSQIAILEPCCQGKAFTEISIDECITAIHAAEGGEQKTRHVSLVQQEATWQERLLNLPAEEHHQRLTTLASERDASLAKTSGNLLRQLYQAGRNVLANDAWPDKCRCPLCSATSDHSLLDDMQANLANYEAVEQATQAIAQEWAASGWSNLATLEKAVKEAGETDTFGEVDKHITAHSISAEQVEQLWTRRTVLIERANTAMSAIAIERAEIEKTLPTSVAAVTTAAEAARRLQTHWREVSEANDTLTTINNQISKLTRVKKFLDDAETTFADAEAKASARRLKAVEPVCQELFAAIMFEPVKPVLNKPEGKEELSLGLSEFWTQHNVSAQALLSESYRNALAVSVYLAAASLYQGAPLFMVLDDVTSSFDAGHQFHLMEVIKNRFARPGNPNGPQVIILSHDTLLEKLFNKNANSADWSHQRLEGTARTAVLPQSNATNRVKDKCEKHLAAGQIDDAAPRLRQYLEFKLLEIISKVQIPVPIDFALDDTKKQVQSAIDAIDAAVKLHHAAGSLVMEAAQVAGLQTNMASITGNFLAHYATGSTQAFSAASLTGVLTAIDAYADCFKFENPPGSGQKQYYRSLSKKA